MTTIKRFIFISIILFYFIQFFIFYQIIFISASASGIKFNIIPQLPQPSSSLYSSQQNTQQYSQWGLLNMKISVNDATAYSPLSVNSIGQRMLVWKNIEQDCDLSNEDDKKKEQLNEINYDSNKEKDQTILTLELQVPVIPPKQFIFPKSVNPKEAFDYWINYQEQKETQKNKLIEKEYDDIERCDRRNEDENNNQANNKEQDIKINIKKINDEIKNNSQFQSQLVQSQNKTKRMKRKSRDNIWNKQSDPDSESEQDLDDEEIDEDDEDEEIDINEYKIDEQEDNKGIETNQTQITQNDENILISSSESLQADESATDKSYIDSLSQYIKEQIQINQQIPPTKVNINMRSIRGCAALSNENEIIEQKQNDQSYSDNQYKEQDMIEMNYDEIQSQLPSYHQSFSFPPESVVISFFLFFLPVKIQSSPSIPVQVNINMQNISLILGTVWNEVKKEKKKDNKLKNKENDITFYDGVFTNEDEEDDYCREEYEYKEQEYEKQDKYLIAEIMNGKIKVDNIGMKKDEDMIVELDIEVCGKEMCLNLNKPERENIIQKENNIIDSRIQQSHTFNEFQYFISPVKVELQMGIPFFLSLTYPTLKNQLFFPFKRFGFNINILEKQQMKKFEKELDIIRNEEYNNNNEINTEKLNRDENKNDNNFIAEINSPSHSAIIFSQLGKVITIVNVLVKLFLLSFTDNQNFIEKTHKLFDEKEEETDQMKLNNKMQQDSNQLQPSNKEYKIIHQYPHIYPSLYNLNQVEQDKDNQSQIMKRFDVWGNNVFIGQQNIERERLFDDIINIIDLNSWIEEEKDGNKEQIKHNIKINFDTIGEGGNMGDLQQVPKDTIIEMIENLEKLRKERESNTLEIIAVALEKDRAITLLYGQ